MSYSLWSLLVLRAMFTTTCFCFACCFFFASTGLDFSSSNLIFSRMLPSSSIIAIWISCFQAYLLVCFEETNKKYIWRVNSRTNNYFFIWIIFNKNFNRLKILHISTVGKILSSKLSSNNWLGRMEILNETFHLRWMIFSPICLVSFQILSRWEFFSQIV